MPETVPNAAEAAPLVDCASDILERMFFTTVFGEMNEADFAPGPFAAARVRFEGPLRGQLVVAADPALARALAADFLGLDSPEEVQDTAVEETLGELANMICGATLSRMDGEGLFTLAHPEIGPHVADLALSGGGVARFLDTGEGALIVRLLLDSAADTTLG